MNDIEILEDFAKGKIQQDKLEHYRGGYKMGFFYTKDLQQAIENLLKERQADKDRIKELENKHIDPSKARLSYNNGKYDVVIDGFIPKSLVKEKIKEVKQLENASISDMLESEKEFCIDVLQELLGEKQ